MHSYSHYADEVLHIARMASGLIMSFYNDKIEVQHKEDNSPVTEADLAANVLIKKYLMRLDPSIPIVSEENSEEENIQAVSGGVFWMVDPLDGTKSYIKHTGEFTVNIALIKNCLPMGGVVYLPVTDTGYFTARDGKAYKQTSNNLPEIIHVRQKPVQDKIIVVASKSHMTERTEEYISSLGGNVTLVSAASSIKFCMIAEGKADIYPRFGNTMEWDTAAGHAVLLAAGGHVSVPDGTPLIYRKDGFLNPFFIARGDIETSAHSK